MRRIFGLEGLGMNTSASLRRAAVAVLPIWLASAALRAAPVPGERVNISAFGTIREFPAAGAPIHRPELGRLEDCAPSAPVGVAAGSALAVEWDEPRRVDEVRLHGRLLPAPGKMDLQYWYRCWPDTGAGGWQKLDDPFNGRWVTATTAAATSGPECLIWTFGPLSKAENPEVQLTGMAHRITYRVRVLFHTPAVVSGIEVLNDSTWKQADVRWEWTGNDARPSESAGVPAGRLAAAPRVTCDNGLVLSPAEDIPATAPLVARTLYASAPDPSSTGRGAVVFHAPGWRSFSVFLDDLAREGGIHVPGAEAFVSDAQRGLTFGQWKQQRKQLDRTILDRVARMPEQTAERAMAAMPRKPEREVYLGVPYMRQEFALRPTGDVFVQKESLRSPSADSERSPWMGRDFLEYRVSTGERPDFSSGGGRQVTRSLDSGWMPIVNTAWETSGILFRQSAFAAPLKGTMAAGEDTRRGDEPLVLLDRIQIENAQPVPATAFVWIELSIKGPMEVGTDGMLRLDSPTDGRPRPGLVPVRGRFDRNGRGELALARSCTPTTPGSPDPQIGDSLLPRPALRYSVRLEPGGRHEVFLSIPFEELLSPNEAGALASIQYDGRERDARAYWTKRLKSRTVYEVPDKRLNDFWQTAYWRALMSTDRDPTTGLCMHGAATVGYLDCANETCMVAEAMEMRGEPQEALRLLQPYIECQGMKRLPGNFRNAEGCFYAAHTDPRNDPYTSQGYNMHHGFVLWKMAEHYLFTRDRAWLQSVAPRLVAGCDWITRERCAAMAPQPDGSRPFEWGLAPAGDLEDVEEYLYWYATNAYFHAGMDAAARVLAEIGYADAPRLRRDADAYRADILASAEASTAHAPVVRLRSGDWVPYVPARVYSRAHLREGWIRETLYNALHLLDGNVLSPSHPAVAWCLDDLEDNLFMSRESGYGVPAGEQDARFFDFGGFSMQPCLLTNAVAHLRRGEPRQFLRAFWNTFAVSYYPAGGYFAEWIPRYGEGAGPLHKTPDEARFLQLMRRMLILEEGNCLHLGAGIPREWTADGKSIRFLRAPTWFGPVDLTVTSRAAQGQIEALATLPSRNPPERVTIRLPHPDEKRPVRVTVNGRSWDRFDPATDVIELPREAGTVRVVADF